MEAIIGINAWFERRGGPRFEPAPVERDAVYTLHVHVASIPYGGPLARIGTWPAPGLQVALKGWADADEDHALTVELQPGAGFVLEGSSSATVPVSRDRLQAARAHASAAAGFEAWLQAQGPDYVHPANPLQTLAAEADAGFVVARLTFDLRATEADHVSWLEMTLTSDDPSHPELDRAEIVVRGTSAADGPSVEIPWGATLPHAAAVAPMEDSAPAPEERARDRLVRIFYATDRDSTGSSQAHRRYSGERGKLETGVLEVSIPPGHEEGEIERPWLGLRWLESADRHVVLISADPLDRPAFFAAMTEMVGQSRRKEAFVFIHGYNVTFEGAALRTGQIAYDLRRLGMDAVPVLYSWPSLGRETGYAVDYDSAEWTADHLAEFLQEVREKSGAEIVHLIAHSMGNKALTLALGRIASSAPGTTPFNEVILAAPDIDAQVFRQLAGKIRAASRRMTLYANSKDAALNTSQALRWGRQRAGDAEGDEIVVVPGVESIDATELNTGFLGHSYFADNEAVILDIHRVLGGGAAPDARPWLEARGSESRRWWAFRGGD